MDDEDDEGYSDKEEEKVSLQKPQKIKRLEHSHSSSDSDDDISDNYNRLAQRKKGGESE